MKCEKCKKKALWRIHSSGSGGSHNKLSCNDDRDVVRDELTATIAALERADGNPLYPAVTRNFSEVQVDAL